VAQAVGIEWVDLFTVMKFFMAIPAKSSPIAYIESKFGVISKRLDMMSYQIPTFVITALLAGEFVPGVNVKTPSLVFSREPNPYCLGIFAILVAVALFTFRCSLSGYLAYLNPGFYRVGLAKSILITLPCLTHFLFGLFRVDSALKSRWAAFGGFTKLDPYTILALRLQSIRTAFVNTKGFCGLPSLAPIAPLQATGYLGFVFSDGYAQLLGSRLDCTFFCLSHCLIS
jgi:hypothetical protein